MQVPDGVCTSDKALFICGDPHNPLFEWGFDRPRCEQVIAAAGLPAPVKSACYFCPASKKGEIAWLQEHHPELLERALHIERNARANLTSVKGLGRSFSWEGYLAQRYELPLLDGIRP